MNQVTRALLFVGITTYNFIVVLSAATITILLLYQLPDNSDCFSGTVTYETVANKTYAVVKNKSHQCVLINKTESATHFCYIDSDHVFCAPGDEPKNKLHVVLLVNVCIFIFIVFAFFMTCSLAHLYKTLSYDHQRSKMAIKIPDDLPWPMFIRVPDEHEPDIDLACRICLDNKARYAYNKCGHKCLCLACVDIMTARRHFKCIMCRFESERFILISGGT